jgi:hypothetical protein
VAALLLATLPACHRAATPPPGGGHGVVAPVAGDAAAPRPAWTRWAIAQTAGWVDDAHVAVGRWDGTVGVFAVPAAASGEPALTAVAATPAGRGVEMLLPLGPGRLVTSNDAGSLADWTLAPRRGLRLAGTATYDPRFGVANAAAIVPRGDRAWLVTGHAQGWVLVWDATVRPPRFRQAIDVRSPTPLRPPDGPPLWNVRGLAALGDGLVAAGAEDGDLTVIAVPEGVVRTRLRYDPRARRGINAVARAGDLLLVASCPSAAPEPNLWWFRVRGDGLAPLGAATLVRDGARAPVYAFDVEAAAAGPARFWAATEEGFLWSGRVDAAGGAQLEWSTSLDPGFAAALALRDGRLAAAGANLRVFTVE